MLQNDKVNGVVVKALFRYHRDYVNQNWLLIHPIRFEYLEFWIKLWHAGIVVEKFELRNLLYTDLHAGVDVFTKLLTTILRSLYRMHFSVPFMEMIDTWLYITEGEFG